MSSTRLLVPSALFAVLLAGCANAPGGSSEAEQIERGQLAPEDDAIAPSVEWVEPDVCPNPDLNDDDGDGLADAEETHTDPCVADTDGDGTGDLLETVYDRITCGRPEDGCLCATHDTGEPGPDFAAVAVRIRLGLAPRSATTVPRSSGRQASSLRGTLATTTTCCAPRSTSGHSRSSRCMPSGRMSPSSCVR